MTRRINTKILEEIINQLKVLAHPVRYSIVIILASNHKMTVTEIHEELSLQQAATSNHLKLMKSSNILNSHKVGKNTYYSVNKETMDKLYCVLQIYAPVVN
ncbi:MAG TPA: metalloregulator ArsR/SmtB family transcription factor [Bacteroidales bacterium]|nr:metalloregulator ArsR/SmtB family transcription factor [Bacteroidales bacterium]